MKALGNIPLLVCLLLVAGATTGQTMQNPSPSPSGNPLLPDQDILGKFLFWEEQISTDNTMSCGTCHIHEFGGSDPRSVRGNHPGPDGIFGTPDDVTGSPGVVRHDVAGFFAHEPVFFPHAQVTGRKAPTAINAGAGLKHMFWDGRATERFHDPVTGNLVLSSGAALESQAAGPPESDVEMAAIGTTWSDIAQKLVTARPLALTTNLPADMASFLARNPTYPDMFQAVYGSPEVTPVKIIFAIANYERTLVSDQTPFDRWKNGQISQLPTAAQRRGLQVFEGAGHCTNCHSLDRTHDDNFHNIGVTDETTDPGRFAITVNPDDRGKFKTPNIRNAKLRLPLMHDGSIATMMELVEFYDRGGNFANAHLDGNLRPLALTQQQKNDLVVFLEDAMTDPRVEGRLPPFTRPTLRSELPPTNSIYGVASLSGTGTPMHVLAHVPANLGHPHWLLGIADGALNTGGFLALAWNPDPGGTPYPDPRFPVPANLHLGSIFHLYFLSTDARGVATVRQPMPANPAFQGTTLYAQFVLADPAAVATGGLYGSEGIAIHLF